MTEKQRFKETHIMNHTVADWTASCLKKRGISRVFMYPGGTIAPLVNACITQGIAIERFASEQGAAYAALAFARLTRQPQVCMVTSGPGLTNAITPLADAFYDSLPLILIAGQVGTKDLSSRQAVRQRGFQEVPAVRITAPIAKRAVCLENVESALDAIPAAFDFAKSGRMGPVFIDFPMDIQRTAIETSVPSISLHDPAETISKVIERASLAEVAEAVRTARRPVILLGQGAQFSGDFDAYQQLASRMDALVVSSFLGLGSFDTTDQRFIGYVGHTGHRAANIAVHESDFLLVLGSRLDVRQTGTMTGDFVPNGRIAWVDIDSNELENPRVDVDWQFHADVSHFCKQLLPLLTSRPTIIDIDWVNRIADLKSQGIEDLENEDANVIYPKAVLSTLYPYVQRGNCAVVTGVGCHQHWAARHLPFAPEGARLLTSGGHGTMGFDLPTAVGAAIQDPERKVLCVVGDGSLLMNIQELMSVAERRLNIKILVMNNNRLGIVSQFQRITWGDDPASGRFHAPDFAKIASGFGIASMTLDNAQDIGTAIEKFWHCDGPVLLNVRINPDSDVVPMLLAGQRMNEMWDGSKP